MAATAAIGSAILITSPPSVSLPANQALQDSGDHTTFLMSSANAAYRYWDNTVAMTFQTSPDGSTSWVNTAPLTVQYVGGKVTFPAAVTGATPSARITVGSYYAYSVLALVSEWDADIEMQVEEITSFTGAAGGGGGSRARVYLPTIPKGTIKIKKWWVDEATMTNLNYITTTTPLILSVVSPSGTRIEGYVWDTKMSIKGAVDKVIEEDLEFQITREIVLA